MDFKRGEELVWEHGNGTSERVKFLKMSKVLLAKPKTDTGTVRTFPQDPQPAALGLRKNGKETTVLLSNLWRPN